MHDLHGTFRDLLHAANLRHGTDGFTSPPKEGVLRIFSPLKIYSLLPTKYLATIITITLRFRVANTSLFGEE